MICPHLYHRWNYNQPNLVLCAMCGDTEFGESLTLEERKRIPSINERPDGPDCDGWWQYDSELCDFMRFPA